MIFPRAAQRHCCSYVLPGNTPDRQNEARPAPQIEEEFISSMDLIPQNGPSSTSGRQKLATLIIVLALAIIAIGMRLYGLNETFDYDGYDEGVYWQTLRAMSAGYGLYKQVFCSQPPAFMLLVYPFYALLGSTISAARVGVATLSLLGLAGAYLMGKALAGRAGGIVAMLILIVTPIYLAESQILQAEGPATALLFLTAGAALMWWEHPTGRKGMALAITCGITLSLGTLIKLLDATAFAPILLLVFARLWQVRRETSSSTLVFLLPIAAAVVAFVVATLVVLAPFLGSLHAALQQVVTFHIAAKKAMVSSEVENIHILGSFFATNAVLSATAIVGIVVTILRCDWRAIPLIAWVLVTFIALIIQAPLFPRHAIVLIPPLIAIIALGLNDLPLGKEMRQIIRQHIPPAQKGALLMGLLALATVLVSIPSDYTYYRTLGARAESSATQLVARIATEMELVTSPDQWVITDAQFVAGLANRDTPPWLVDTSAVRVLSGYLTTQELLQAGSDARVHAVLFATNRLAVPPVASFRYWVAGRFYPLRTYGTGIELWIR